SARAPSHARTHIPLDGVRRDVAAAKRFAYFGKLDVLAATHDRVVTHQIPDRGREPQRRAHGRLETLISLPIVESITESGAYAVVVDVVRRRRGTDNASFDFG